MKILGGNKYFSGKFKSRFITGVARLFVVENRSGRYGFCTDVIANRADDVGFTVIGNRLDLMNATMLAKADGGARSFAGYVCE